LKEFLISVNILRFGFLHLQFFEGKCGQKCMPSI
jgi:hypothetical protein